MRWDDTDGEEEKRKREKRKRRMDHLHLAVSLLRHWMGEVHGPRVIRQLTQLPSYSLR